MRRTLGIAAAATSVLAAALTLGTAKAEAHQPVCTPVLDGQTQFFFTTFGEFNFYWHLSCPASKVDQTERNSTNCGSAFGSLQGEVIFIHGSPGVDCEFQEVEPYPPVYLPQANVKSCSTGLVQTLRAFGVQWREHRKAAPNGTGPFWTEAFGANLASSPYNVTCGLTQ